MHCYHELKQKHNECLSVSFLKALSIFITPLLNSLSGILFKLFSLGSIIMGLVIFVKDMVTWFFMVHILIMKLLHFSIACTF